MPSNIDLLIIGAGPAGLMAASWASHYSMTTRIIDQKRGRTPTGHADGIQHRTMEILNSFGIVDPILRHGVHDVEMCYWGPNKETGHIERRKRLPSQPGNLSQFGQMLYNQGQIEQVLLDYIAQQGRISVEWNTKAEGLEFVPNDDSEADANFPVLVKVRDSRGKTEVIRPRYLIGCDGAHSWTREQLKVPMDSHSEHSTWGVLDVIPITDFPDIRQSCAIQSPGHGSIMTAPREDRLVRLYIQVKGDDDPDQKAQENSEDTPKALIQAVEKSMKPYKLTFKHCDWWSIYPVVQRMVEQYRMNDRIFLAGDAAHTHSPMAGQGMNVSMQDVYNLVWKLGAVLTGVADLIILDTYEAERRPVAKELMEMDSVLVQAYEHEAKETGELDEVRDKYSGFMSGVQVTYSSNMLVASDEKSGNMTRAKNITVGMRIPSFPVVNHADGAKVPLLNILASNGSWRLLVFSGDLQLSDAWDHLLTFVNGFKQRSHLARWNQRYSRPRRPQVEIVLVHASPRGSFNLLDLPDIFHPFDADLGWDYWKAFADDGAYVGYGIDKNVGCLVLCRPDQHVAWVGGMDDIAGLDNYFSGFSARPTGKPGRFDNA
ncbi:putative FAD monooxygenase [Aspergillus clavatus NRRL 1]|uniref:FAD binding domain protein n=1 Tax=Aspergillus clavatus (strain ATCC 1007 / CBS 513.65 / DSM 816 / NCTC 3887 / NRRL 1 / QM 1276 / 107) TaxID=344612 RepID=A1CE06_ASPCL|nr:FAD binding domain protein [Aspergillus clavatus NRRL 1]EAW12083.1 FAD binding domain protein [Aspergillus clavatus NRRL 1]